MTTAEKRGAIEMWKSGEFTLVQIAEKYKRTVRTLTRIFKAHGVKRGSSSAALNARVADQLAAKSAEEALLIGTRIRETRDSGYKILSAIEKLAAHEISEARRLGQPLATTYGAQRALKVAAETIMLTWRGRAEILGIANLIPDSDELPELRITELTNEEIRQMTDQASISELDSDLEEIDASILKSAAAASATPPKAST